MPSLRLTDPVQYAQGIGPVRAEVLGEVGVETVHDLLYYFPRRYLDRRSITPLDQLKVGAHATVIGKVVALGLKHTARRRFFQITIAADDATLVCLWFNGIDWISGRFQVGDRVALHGKVEFYNQLQLVHPDFDRLDDEADPLNTGQIIPLYPVTAGLRAKQLDSRALRRVIRRSWGRIGSIPDHFPPAIRRMHHLLGLGEALRQIHAPDGQEQLAQAVHRLKFDEHFFLQLLMALRRRAARGTPGQVFAQLGSYTPQLYRHLPFDLTGAQVRVMREIRADLSSGRVMNRLLQGDVGSGKTVVAILAAAIVAGGGGQVAIMAPTEILAEQHYRQFAAPCRAVGLSVGSLTGSLSRKERTPLLAALQNGELKLIVGTHALIQKSVTFANLALLIIDEQHRFGVQQRGLLQGKGKYPHILAMTATPIPRTLAITYHGDMDVSLLDELPAGRGRVATSVVEENGLPAIYEQMRGEMNQGRQCYVVYPLIEESEKSDLKAAQTAFSELRTKVFPEMKVGYLDGRLKSEEKEAVMEAFGRGDVQLLVSTTVVEVGIDVAAATVMVIENAERFGLTQLHQLRGRIGRSALDGRCYLIRRGGGEEAARRLAILERTTDGFEISDEDLILRGPGEFFGARQHGREKMRLAQLPVDGPIIRSARQAAFTVIQQDPVLEKREHQALKTVLLRNYSQQLKFVRLN